MTLIGPFPATRISGKVRVPVYNRGIMRIRIMKLVLILLLS